MGLKEDLFAQLKALMDSFIPSGSGIPPQTTGGYADGLADVLVTLASVFSMGPYTFQYNPDTDTLDLIYTPEE